MAQRNEETVDELKVFGSAQHIRNYMQRWSYGLTTMTLVLGQIAKKQIAMRAFFRLRGEHVALCVVSDAVLPSPTSRTALYPRLSDLYAMRSFN